MSALAAIDFTLPPQLEAREPAELRASGRDDVRMLVSQRRRLRSCTRTFASCRAFLAPGDLLVLNTTATVPAALTALRENGDEIALHWSTSLPGGLAVMEPRKVQGRAGETLTIPGGGTRHAARAVSRLAAPLDREARRSRCRRSSTSGAGDVRSPTSYIPKPFPLSAYQTVFARSAGSAEMPSAGRPFTRSLLACLRRSGVQLARLVLARRRGQPRTARGAVRGMVRSAAAHRGARARARTRADGRVVAVGTTVVRALESSVDARRQRHRLARLDRSRHHARARRARRRRPAHRTARAASHAPGHARSHRRTRASSRARTPRHSTANICGTSSGTCT